MARGTAHRMLLHIGEGLREAVDPGDVYYIEAREGDTLVRLRRAKPKIDVRRFEKVLPLFERLGFVRVHREYAVNVDRIRLIRRRERGRDWEIVLAPPVNAIIPVSRESYPALIEAFESS